MARLALVVLALLPMFGATVDTVALGTLNGPSPQAASDAQGNIYLITQVPCSVLQECQPFSLVKLDATGRVLFRRGVGEPNWRLQVSHLAVDAAGNIVLGGVTADPNLPTVRAIRTKPEGASDAYLLQLSPDASRILFATYVGGNGADQLAGLALDRAGNAVATIITQSPDFPFTSRDVPAGSNLQVLFAVVRLDLAAGRLVYAHATPFTGRPADLSLTAAGAAIVVAPNLGVTGPPPSRFQALSLAPDGTRSSVPLRLPNEVQVERLLPAEGGGYWFTAQAPGGVLAATPNAWRPESSAYSYVRWEDNQAITPPGPLRAATVRLIAADSQNGNRLFAATNRGLYRTEDNGWTWELMTDAPAFANITAMASGAGRLWVVVPAGGVPALQVSTDAGATFREVAFPTRGIFGPLALAVHPTDPETLVLSVGSTFYLSRNSGETWTQRSFAGNIVTLAADGEYVALVTVAGGNPSQPPAVVLHYSTDGGTTFSRTTELSTPPTALRFDPYSPGRLYGALLLNGPPRLVRTTAATFPNWEELSPAGVPVMQFAFQAGLPGALVALSADGSLLRSVDEGFTYQPLNGARLTGTFVSQLTVGAGGVVHLTAPNASELVLGRLDAAGEVTYVTYLGLRNTSPALLPLSGGGVAVTGQFDSSSLPFPGEVLRGTLPNGFVPPSTGVDLLAIAFDRETNLQYALSLAGASQELLLWSGPGANASLLLLGTTFSPDFPGLTAPVGGPTLFLSRITP